MSIIHLITGYNKGTERLEYRFEVPESRLAEVQRLAHVPELEDDNYGVFPIDKEDAWMIAWRLELPMNVDYCDWFLEPVARHVVDSGGLCVNP